MTHKVTMLLSNPYRPDPRVKKEAKSLVEAGYQVSLVCWDRKLEYPAHELIDGIEVFRIRVPSKYSLGSRQLIHLPRFWQGALKLLNCIKPKVVHCHDLDTMPAGYWYRQFHPTVKWIYDAHECYPAQIGPQVATWIAGTLDRLDQFMTQRVDCVITVSDSLAGYFKNMGGEASVVGNYHMINQCTGSLELTREEIGFSIEDFIIAYIGGFTPARAIIPLVQAASLYPTCKIFVAGDGIQRPSIEKEVQRHTNVSYLGWVPQSLVMAYTKIADVIYYGLYNNNKNSHYSSPNTLFNAMHAGKPIITTNIGDIASIVKKVNCGMVIETPSPEHIAEKIWQLADPGTRSKLGRNGMLAVVERYNWGEAEKILLDLYGSIV